MLGKKLLDAGVATFASKANNDIATNLISGAMGRDIGPEEAQQIMDAMRLRGEIPGFNPSLGESIYKSGLSDDMLATQRQLEANMSPGERSVARDRYNQNLESIRDYGNTFATKNFGPQDADPQQIVDTLSGKVDDLAAPLRAQSAKIGQLQDQQASALPQNVQLEAGQALRGREVQMKDDESKRLSQLADTLGLNNTNISLPFKQFQATVKQKYAPKPFEDPDQQPQAFQDIMDFGDGANAPQAKFDDLMTLRSRIGMNLRQAMTDKQDQAAMKLAGMQHDLDEFIGDSLPNSSDPQLQAAYDTFRSQYKTDMVDRFKQGVAYNIRSQNGQSFYQVPDEKVAGLFFNSPSGARQFTTTFRDDPEAVASLKDAVLDNLRQATVRDGRVNPTLYDNWMRRNTASLNELPDEIQSSVNNIGDVSQDLAARATVLDARTKQIQDMLLTKRLAKVKEFADDPDGFVDQTLSNPELMRQTVGQLRGSPDSMQSFQRLLWQKAQNSSPEDMEALLDNPSMKLALNPDHIEALRNIFSATKMATSAGKMAGVPYNIDPYSGFRTQAGQGIDSAVAKLWAVENKRVGLPYFLTNVAGIAFRAQRRNAITRVFNQALYDPQVAKNFAESLIDRSPISPSATKMRGYIFNAGYDMYGGNDDQR